MANDPSDEAGTSTTSAPAKAEAKPAGVAPAQSAAAPETKYTRSQWRERARTVFRTSPHAIEGALHDRREDDEISEDEVRSALDEFSIVEGLS